MHEIEAGGAGAQLDGRGDERGVRGIAVGARQLLAAVPRLDRGTRLLRADVPVDVAVRPGPAVGAGFHVVREADGDDLESHLERTAAEVPDEEIDVGSRAGGDGGFEIAGRPGHPGVGDGDGPGGGLGGEAGFVGGGEVVGHDVAVARGGREGGGERRAGDVGHGGGTEEAAVAPPMQGGGGDAVVVGDGGGDGPRSGRGGDGRQGNVSDDGGRGDGTVVMGIGVVGGFELVLGAVAIGVGVAVLAQRAVVAELEPVGQAVGIAIQGGGQIGGGRQPGGGHGNARDLAGGRGGAGGPAEAVDGPARERERDGIEDMAFGSDQAGGDAVAGVPSGDVEGAGRRGGVREDDLLLPKPREGGVGGQREIAEVGRAGGRDGSGA